MWVLGYLHVTLVVGFGGDSTGDGPDGGVSGSGTGEFWIRGGSTDLFKSDIIFINRDNWVVTPISSLRKSLQKAIIWQTLKPHEQISRGNLNFVLLCGVLLSDILKISLLQVLHFHRN